MTRILTVLLLTVAALAAAAGAQQPGGRNVAEVRLMTLDPGHFHAALVQKEMYPGVAPRVDVYAPLGPDLLEHLGRIAAYNRRPDKQTSWAVDTHTGHGDPERSHRS